VQLEVTIGEVPIRWVTARRGRAGIFVLEISTPRDKHPVCNFAEGASSVTIELHAAVKGRADFNPSRVVVTPENQDEADAIAGGVCEFDYGNWIVILLMLPAAFLESADHIASWDQRSRAQSADYLSGV
jgi:hypothetical protein